MLCSRAPSAQFTPTGYLSFERRTCLPQSDERDVYMPYQSHSEGADALGPLVPANLDSAGLARRRFGWMLPFGGQSGRAVRPYDATPGEARGDRLANMQNDVLRIVARRQI
jgi:hypothetical protein